MQTEGYTPFSGFIPSKDENQFLQMILSELMNAKDIDLKTELPNPLAMTRIQTLADYYEKNGWKKSAELLRDFCNYYKLNMVSNKRKGRLEIVQVATEIGRVFKNMWTGKQEGNK